MLVFDYIIFKIDRKVQETYYKKLGFECKVGDTLKIPINKVPVNCHKMVLVKCDMCNHEHYLKYQAYCSCTKNNTEPYYCKNKECINKKREQENFKKYGHKNVFELNSVKDKIKETNNILYGVDNPQQNKDIKNRTEETNIKIYGFRNVFQNEEIKEKSKITNLKNLGVEYSTQSSLVIDKTKITNNKNYGTDYPIQNKNFFNSIKRKYFELKKFRDSDILYQASYELDFLNKYYDSNTDIENGVSFKYIHDNKNKVYHSDFYIPSKNLIIEIKNSYLYKRDFDKIKAKEKSVIKNGYNYILILNKNYTEFEKLI